MPYATPVLRTFLTAAAIVTLLAIFAFPALPASAHAYLDRSNPPANDVIEEMPDEVRLWFTEPLEPDHSFILLYDATGDELETDGSEVDPDNPTQMHLPLPDNLPNGTYTVQWRNISSVDGHPQSGFFAFTIGSRDDMSEPVAPPEDATTGDPGIIEPLGRWLSFIGITAAVGAVFAWLWAIRPTLNETGSDVLPRSRQYTRRLAITGLAVAFFGAIVGLIAQTIVVTRGLSIGDLVDTLTNTQYGTSWTLRIAQFGLFAVVLLFGALWRQSRVRRTGWMALVIALLALLPFSMSSHAAALPAGTTVAILSDWLHLAATSVWIGGLMALAAGAIIPSRQLAPADRQTFYANLIPRFSTLAIISVIVLALTGLYAAWLQVGSLRGMQETEYGQALALKLLLTVPLLGLGAINQFVIGPWMRRAADAGRHFGRTVAAEITLGAVVLGVVAVLVSIAPARDTLESEAQTANFRFEAADLTVGLYISPGAVGQNRYTVDIVADEERLSPDTEVELRLGRDDEAIGGVRLVTLERSGEDIGPRSVRYEATGTDLSVPGEWELELVVFRPGQADWRAERVVDVPEVPAQDQIPAPPPRFAGFQAMAIPLALALAVVFGVLAIRNRFETESDRVMGGLTAMLVLFSAVAMWQTMVDTTPTTNLQNPVLMTVDSVETGRALYQENCAVCHGEDGTVTGVDTSNLAVRPADLTDAHVDIHPDGDLFWWIKEGIDPTMPAFGDELSDEEIWHLVNYVRNLRDPVDE